jgi:ATP-dependent RNA helicase DDX21
MSGSEGFMTFMLTAPAPVYSLSYVWNALRNSFPAEVVEEFRGMTLTTDGLGAAFDVPSNRVALAREVAADPTKLISIPTVLPELKASAAMDGGRGSFGGGGGGRFGGGGGRFGGGGFRGGRGGGFARGRGRSW